MFKFKLLSGVYSDILEIRELLKDVEYTLDRWGTYTVKSESLELKNRLSWLDIEFL